MYPEAELELESRSVAHQSGGLPQKVSGIRRKDMPFVVPLPYVRAYTSANYLVLAMPERYKEPHYTDKETGSREVKKPMRGGGMLMAQLIKHLPSAQVMISQSWD